jgi:hypothetical protein
MVVLSYVRVRFVLYVLIDAHALKKFMSRASVLDFYYFIQSKRRLTQSGGTEMTALSIKKQWIDSLINWDCSLVWSDGD